MINDQKLGAEIARLRHEFGYTQTDICTKMGLTRNFYSLFENGKRRMSIGNLEKICLILKIKVWKLIKLSEE